MNRKASIVLFIIAITLLLIAHFAEAQEERSVPDSDSQSLNGTSWWVEDILEKGVVDRSHTTIEFFQAGQVSGDTGCNRYTGTVQRDGETVRFGPLAGTRRACLAALMEQESRFYSAMERATVLRVDEETGLLSLYDADGNRLLRASNIVPVSEE